MENEVGKLLDWPFRLIANRKYAVVHLIAIMFLMGWLTFASCVFYCTYFFVWTVYICSKFKLCLSLEIHIRKKHELYSLKWSNYLNEHPILNESFYGCCCFSLKKKSFSNIYRCSDSLPSTSISLQSIPFTFNYFTIGLRLINVSWSMNRSKQQTRRTTTTTTTTNEIIYSFDL